MLFAATASHPMIVLEFRHISMRLCLRATEVDHAAHAVAAIVKQQGFKEACVVGHSFGTFVASRLCQMHPAMVQSLVSMSCYITPALCQHGIMLCLASKPAFVSGSACGTLCDMCIERCLDLTH